MSRVYLPGCRVTGWALGGCSPHPFLGVGANWQFHSLVGKFIAFCSSLSLPIGTAALGPRQGLCCLLMLVLFNSKK